ncbi:hypothetical protein TIFTF001_030900 [Ficus carica]|uniref:Ubiquitin-like protease family profile domain-containing protein n=1 Tax=Ficus carica TaxID=3494 RepID=A0AA88J4E4_FICCA|nr:hypothetical protein TIFTF001_030900 [Ficus carica]
MHLEDLKHWVLVKLNLLNWTIEVYDSLHHEGPHNYKIRKALECMSKFIPMVADMISLFEFKPRYPPGTYLIPGTIIQDIPRQENGTSLPVVSITMTSAVPNSLRFLTLGQNPTNPWPSGTTLCLGRIDNLGSNFFRNILALHAGNQMDYRCIGCIEIIFRVVMRAIIVRINSSVVTDGHNMRARNLIDLKASASTGHFSHIHNPGLGSIVSNDILKLISWPRL